MASIIPAIWLLGTATLATRLLVGHRRMARLRATSIPAEPDALALCHALAGQMRLKLPGVFRSPFLSSPCLDGPRRPAILPPEDAERHLRFTNFFGPGTQTVYGADLTYTAAPGRVVEGVVRDEKTRTVMNRLPPRLRHSDRPVAGSAGGSGSGAAIRAPFDVAGLRRRVSGHRSGLPGEAPP
jgi:hypothetical protein